MKKFVSIIMCACVLLCGTVHCRALGVSAKSAALIEAVSGRIIYEKASDTRLPMASTTKIMTALCAAESGRLDELITVDPSAVGVEGSSIYLKQGERLTLRELTYGLMLSSGNDAAVAIACAVSGSVEKFAELMNSTAEKIGATNTHFMNPNGLDEAEHYTTAADLASITAYALKNEEFKTVVSTYEKTIPYEGCSYDRHLRNHNKLLKLYKGCIGVKTGFTKKSGRCLVSAAQRDGVTLVAVTLNAPDDWNDHTSMLNYGFERVKAKEVLKKDSYVQTLKVKGGTQNAVRLLCAADVFVPEISGLENKVSLKYKISKEINAPVGYRQNVGTVEVYLNGELLQSVNAVTASAVAIDDTKTLKRSALLILSDFFGFRIIGS